MNPREWVLPLFLLLVATSKCQEKKELDSSDPPQQKIDDIERREGKPQDSGNGKDILIVILLCLPPKLNEARIVVVEIQDLARMQLTFVCGFTFMKHRF